MGGIKKSVEAKPKPKDLEGSKNTKGKPLGRPSSLSAVYIVDSDSDDGVEHIETNKKSTKLQGHQHSTNGALMNDGITKSHLPSSQSTTHHPKKTIIPEKKSTTANSYTAKARSKKGSPSRKVVLEITSGEDSGKSEDDEESEESEDADGSDDSTESTVPEKTTPPILSIKALPKRPRVVADSQESSESDESGDKSSEGKGTHESASEQGEQPESRAVRSSVSSDKSPKPSKSFPPPYQPPPGFKPATITIPKNSALRTLFSSVNLASKEIWHITLPSTVPIDLIKQVPLEEILRGGTTLTHNGADYGFAVETKGNNSDPHVLLPSDQGNYRATSGQVSRVLHLQQTLKLPDLGTSAQNDADGAHGTIEARTEAHIQPPGLKMRYVPIGDKARRPQKLGFDSSSDESDAKTSSSAAPVFRRPPGFHTVLQGDAEGAKDASDSDDAPSLSPSRDKHRKRRVEPVDNSVEEASPRKRSKKRRDQEKIVPTIGKHTLSKRYGSEPKNQQEEKVNDPIKHETKEDVKHSAAQHPARETAEERVARKAEKHKRRDKARAQGLDPLGEEQVLVKKESRTDDRKENGTSKKHATEHKSPDKHEKHRKADKEVPNGSHHPRVNGDANEEMGEDSEDDVRRKHKGETAEQRALRKAAKHTTRTKEEHEARKKERKRRKAEKMKNSSIAAEDSS